MEGDLYDGTWFPGVMPDIFDPQWYNPGISTLPQIPEVEIENRVLGVNPHVQTFYEGPPKCDCCANWIEKPPTQLPEVAKERYDEASVRVYKKKDHESASSRLAGLVSMKDEIVEIQSQLIADLIRPILAEVGRLAPERDRIKFGFPFRDLYFAHPKIVQLSHACGEDSDERQHFNVLIEVMDDLFSRTSAEVRDLLDRKTISFKYVWTLFPKDIVVYSREYNTDRLYQVVDVEYLKPDKTDWPMAGWKLECRSFIFDGTNFGTTSRNFLIWDFADVRRISRLKPYPLGFHPDRKLEHKMKKRGKRVLDFQGLSHCEHHGVASSAHIVDEDLPSNLSSRVTGRVIIDGLGFKNFNANFFNEARALEPSALEPATSKNGNSKGFSQTSAHASEVRTAELAWIDPDEDRRPSTQEQKWNRDFFLEHPEYLLIMDPFLPGYSLTLNKWFTFQVDNLKALVWNSDALDQLVLPDHQKSFLLTFVERHKKSSNQDTDFISGKGQGLAILLSGPTGTGKTLTCEAIADRVRRPLYRLQAENLGSQPKEIGHNLSEAFALSLHWNAIILLDEADSLLSKRSLDNNVRNEIVSVVLRHLEYYSGVIFMTTNLLQNIDEAFQSRINIHLCYKPLSLSSRSSLWQNFFSRLDLSLPDDSGLKSVRVQMTPRDWDKLATWQLNGREIKNSARNAQLWCKYEGFDITLDKIENAIEATAPFAPRAEDPSEDLQISRKRTRVALE